MHKPLLSLIVICSLFISCKKEQDPFQIGTHNIGLLTDSTQVKDLELVFTNDSISKPSNNNAFTKSTSDIVVYDKTGKKLLALTPNQANDSTSTIKIVDIYDERFKTDKNISKLSTFKNINDNYKVSGINNLLSTLLISVNEINATFAIDKKELPANLRFDRNLNIEASQIPDNAKIKYFMINWN